MEEQPLSQAAVNEAWRPPYINPGKAGKQQAKERISVEMNVHDDQKMVDIWLTNTEKNDPEIRQSLQDIYKEYQKKNYLVAVFESGGQDLYQNTLDLLRYNRRRSAEREVQRKKRAAVWER